MQGARTKHSLIMELWDRIFFGKADNSCLIDGVRLEKYIVKLKKHQEFDKVLKMWRCVLGLKNWYVVFAYRSDAKKEEPVGMMENNKFWLYVYTSEVKAQKYLQSHQTKGIAYQIYAKAPISILDCLYKGHCPKIYGLYINESDQSINAHFSVSVQRLEKLIRCTCPSFAGRLFVDEENGSDEIDNSCKGPVTEDKGRALK